MQRLGSNDPDGWVLCTRYGDVDEVSEALGLVEKSVLVPQAGTCSYSVREGSTAVLLTCISSFNTSKGWKYTRDCVNLTTPDCTSANQVLYFNLFLISEEKTRTLGNPVQFLVEIAHFTEPKHVDKYRDCMLHMHQHRFPPSMDNMQPYKTDRAAIKALCCLPQSAAWCLAAQLLHQEVGPVKEFCIVQLLSWCCPEHVDCQSKNTAKVTSIYKAVSGFMQHKPIPCKTLYLYAASALENVLLNGKIARGEKIWRTLGLCLLRSASASFYGN